MRPHRDMGAVG